MSDEPNTPEFEAALEDFRQVDAARMAQIMAETDPSRKAMLKSAWLWKETYMHRALAGTLDLYKDDE